MKLGSALSQKGKHWFSLPQVEVTTYSWGNLWPIWIGTDWRTWAAAPVPSKTLCRKTLWWSMTGYRSLPYTLLVRTSSRYVGTPLTCKLSTCSVSEKIQILYFSFWEAKANLITSSQEPKWREDKEGSFSLDVGGKTQRIISGKTHTVRNPIP